jgi:hypothetical protein
MLMTTDLDNMNYTIFNTANDTIDLTPSFEEAYVYLPAGFRGNEKPVEGTLKEIRILHPELNEPGEQLATLVVLPGSKALGVEKIIAKYCCDSNGIALIYLDTHAIKNRPSYESPAPREIYNSIHQLRKAEVDLFIERQGELSWINPKKMMLIGLSEGAVTAASYPGSAFDLRIFSSWPCEQNYFVDEVLLGGDNDTWFLNIIGYKDHFFGVNSSLNSHLPIKGHGAEVLQSYPNSKVVILPNAGHRLFEDSHLAIKEINSFISCWLTSFSSK